MGDLISHSSIDIDATGPEIWPYILDTSCWKTAISLVPISGSSGQYGERFEAVLRVEPETALYYVETVELVVHRRRTLRLNTIDGRLIGFASWRLIPRSGSTRVEYDVFCYDEENDVGAASSPTPSVAPADDHHAENRRRFSDELSLLKKLIEEGSCGAKFAKVIGSDLS